MNPKVKTALIVVTLSCAISFIPQLFQGKKQEKVQNINKQEKLKKFRPILEWKNKQEDYSSQEKFTIRDVQELKKKLKAIKQAGFQELQIVTDFDHTITPFKYKGKPSPSSFGMLRVSPVVSQQMVQNMQKLFDKYYPLEQDNSLPHAEKDKYMLEWNNAIEEEFKTSGIDEQILQDTMDRTNTATRYGFNAFINNLFNYNVPLYVVSGGLNAIVHTVLNSCVDINNYKNLFVLSNELVMNNHGKIVDMEMKVTTSSKFKVLNTDKYTFKKNTFLFGDTNNDFTMSKEMKSENVVSVLFLKPGQQDKINEYLDQKWDIIIQNEEEVAGYVSILHLLELMAGDDFDIDISQTDQKNFQEQECYTQIREIIRELE